MSNRPSSFFKGCLPSGSISILQTSRTAHCAFCLGPIAWAVFHQSASKSCWRGRVSSSVQSQRATHCSCARCCSMRLVAPRAIGIVESYTLSMPPAHFRLDWNGMRRRSLVGQNHGIHIWRHVLMRESRRSAIGSGLTRRSGRALQPTPSVRRWRSSNGAGRRDRGREFAGLQPSRAGRRIGARIHDR